MDKRYTVDDGFAEASGSEGAVQVKGATAGSPTRQPSALRVLAHSMGAAADGVSKIGKKIELMANKVDAVDQDASKLIRTLGDMAELSQDSARPRSDVDAGEDRREGAKEGPDIASEVPLHAMPRLIAEALRLASNIRKDAGAAGSQVRAAAIAV